MIKKKRGGYIDHQRKRVGVGKMKRKIEQHLCTLAKLRLSASMSSTCHQAARSSPRWQPPDLELQATLDDNFIGLESPLEVEILVSNLYTFV